MDDCYLEFLMPEWTELFELSISIAQLGDRGDFYWSSSIIFWALEYSVSYKSESL